MVAHRELVAEDAAPIVQHEDDLAAGGRALGDVLHDGDRLLERVRAAGLGDVEARQRMNRTWSAVGPRARLIGRRGLASGRAAKKAPLLSAHFWQSER